MATSTVSPLMETRTGTFGVTALKNILPNPWRDVKNFHYSMAKLAALEASYNASGFYGVFVVRAREDGQFELLGQHHRHKQAVLSYGEDYEVPIQIRKRTDEEMLADLIASDDHIYASTPSSVLGTITRMIEQAEIQGRKREATVAQIGAAFGWKKAAAKSGGTKAEAFYTIAMELRKPDPQLNREVFNILPNLESAILFYTQMKKKFWDRFLTVSLDQQLKIAKMASQDSTRAALNLAPLFANAYTKISGATEDPDATVQVAGGLFDSIVKSLNSVQSSYRRFSRILNDHPNSTQTLERISEAYTRKNIYSTFLQLKDQVSDLERGLRLRIEGKA